MTSSNFIAWYLQKGGVNYKTWHSNQQIIYRPNNWQEANLIFDISDSADAIRNQISGEDEVSVWIGDPAGSGVKMIQGFVNSKYPIRRKDASRFLYVDVIDYIGYFGAKSIFEKRYWLLANATAKQTFSDAADAIPGIGGKNIDSNLTLQVKQDFAGTYSKDGFAVASQAGYADFFGDESKFLQAFSHGGRDLKASNNVRYKIKDTAPGAVNEIRVNHNFDYYYKKDMTNRFKTVIMTSGVAYTWPSDINLFQDTGEKTALRGIHGPEFSTHYSSLQTRTDYDVNNFASPSVAVKPFDYEQLQIGSINYPVVILRVANAIDAVSFLVGQMELTNFLFPSLGLPLDGTWQEISFFMRIDGLSPTPTNVNMSLIDLTHGGSYDRNLKQGSTTLFLVGGMTFIRFLLPTPIQLNGWTKTGTISQIDQIVFSVTPSTGYTAGSTIKMSQFYLYKRVRKTSSTVGGSPATQKIIMNRTLIDDVALQSMADSEFQRVSPVPYEVKSTFYGNSDFRKPGYAIDVDFTNTLESDSLGTQLRIDQIIHTLEKSRWNTELTLKPAYQRL